MFDAARISDFNNMHLIKTILTGFTEGFFVYIDEEWKVVIKPIYESARPFSKGRAQVKVKGQWGVIDRSGAFLLKPRYFDMGEFSQGLAAVRFKGQEYLDQLDDLFKNQ